MISPVFHYFETFFYKQKSKLDLKNDLNFFTKKIINMATGLGTNEIYFVH